MSLRQPAPAQLPPDGLAGLDPAWSRLVTAPDHRGEQRTWHVLDSHAGRALATAPRHTLLCLHGNPSWSYLWRRVIADGNDAVRVIAPDQLEMGWSERTGHTRRLADRIADLGGLTDALELEGPVVVVAHDWGGPVALGWALQHGEDIEGIVLTNTAVHQPPGSPAPAVIRAVRSRSLLRRITVHSDAFVRGAVDMSRPRPSTEVRKGFLAPYRTAERRVAIEDFVVDIPLDAGHPSAETLDSVAAGLDQFAGVPALLLWGPNDKVFSDLYLHDLEARLPHARVHRFGGASHFVTEDADVSGALYDWLTTLDWTMATDSAAAAGAVVRPTFTDPSGSDPSIVAGTRPAVAEMSPRPRSMDVATLEERTVAVASGLAEHGVAPGDRVALMVPPGIDLTTALYGCWRLGAVAVLIDSGLGPRGMQRAMAAAAPDHLIGIDRALVAAKALRWPGRRFGVAPGDSRVRRALGCIGDLESIAAAAGPLQTDPPSPDDPAAVVFTSGATGPSKGVRYRHHQVAAQVDVLRELYDIGPDDRLVAAFAPFALYGPALGIASVVPDMDVAAPATLTAAALGDAAVAVDATLVFASPAAIVNVLATASGLTEAHRAAFARVRLLLSAGAPVRSGLLRSALALFPNAVARTPYGMTEVLPVADIDLDAIDDAVGGDGVCVGAPVPGVSVQVAALDELGRPGPLTAEPDVVGEIVVSAAHARDGYDRLWHTEHRASQPMGWHRTGDVGHLDEAGRLWIGGRLGHVVSLPGGPRTPVAIEQAVERLPDVAMAAAVGVGPVGAQQLVVVLQRREAVRRPTLGDQMLHLRVREAVDVAVAAVFSVPALPVDRRHNSKVDRAGVARWAADVLAGRRMRRLR